MSGQRTSEEGIHARNLSQRQYNDLGMSSEHYCACSVVIYSGSQFHSGHYYIYRMVLEESWCLCSDEKVGMAKLTLTSEV